MKDLPPQPKTINGLFRGVYPSFAMLAGMQLDLFTPLKDGPLNTEQIADAIGVSAAKLTPLLYALAAAGLLTVEGDLFSNTTEANHFLVRGSPSYIGGECEILSDLWNAALKTAESIRTGAPQAKHDYANMAINELESFLRGLHPDAIATGYDLVARYDFSSARTLLDVGGGSGGLAIAVTQACPHLRATVVDLPTVTPIIERFVEEACAAERVQVVAADVVDDALMGSFDAVVLKAFIQVLSPNQARSALRNISAVTRPGGVIYILGAGILDDSRVSPPEAAMFNIVFLNLYEGGQAYTEGEYKDWLIEAGFENFERVILPGGESILTARKPT